MNDLYRKETYEARRDTGDGEAPGEDMVTYRTRFVVVEPCEHGKIDKHDYLTESTCPTADIWISCEGAGLENTDE